MDLLLTDSMGWTPIMIKTIVNEALINAHQAVATSYLQGLARCRR